MELSWLHNVVLVAITAMSQFCTQYFSGTGLCVVNHLSEKFFISGANNCPPLSRALPFPGQMKTVMKHRILPLAWIQPEDHHWNRACTEDESVSRTLNIDNTVFLHHYFQPIRFKCSTLQKHGSREHLLVEKRTKENPWPVAGSWYWTLISSSKDHSFSRNINIYTVIYGKQGVNADKQSYLILFGEDILLKNDKIIQQQCNRPKEGLGANLSWWCGRMNKKGNPFIEQGQCLSNLDSGKDPRIIEEGNQFPHMPTSFWVSPQGNPTLTPSTYTLNTSNIQGLLFPICCHSCVPNLSWDQLHLPRTSQTEPHLCNSPPLAPH